MTPISTQLQDSLNCIPFGSYYVGVPYLVTRKHMRDIIRSGKGILTGNTLIGPIIGVQTVWTGMPMPLSEIVRLYVS